MKSVRQLLLLLTCCFFVVGLGLARAQMPSLDAKTQTEVVNKIANLLQENYVFPEVGGKAGQFIQERLGKGAYTSLTSPHLFSEQLTKDLQSVTHDKHMRVFMAPPPPDKKEDPAEREMRFVHQDARNNFGFYKLERLSGNVGYLDLRGFSPAQFGGATAIAAMNFLANSDAVIIDLRKNGGGDPSMIQLISSYFFKEPTHLNNLYWRKGDHTDQFWSLPYVPGKSMAEVPLYVLTSARTFSGAEEFTNNMKVLKRAKIIGETTGGGANPGGFFPIAAGLGMFIPTGRAVNPVTGANWEGTGVEPDERVAAKDAFNIAYKEALEKIAAETKDPQAKADAAWALAGVEAQLHPANLSPDDLKALAGAYGTRHIVAESGQLYLQIEDRPRMKLSPMPADTFAVEGTEAPRLRFTAGGKGGRKLTEVFPDGRQIEFPSQ
ncbi:MAG TPA: S41 family peptidase [Terriglobales bacterium]|nr:S41 family peptidase [Terriglobales bacterium]